MRGEKRGWWSKVVKGGFFFLFLFLKDLVKLKKPVIEFVPSA